VLAGAAATLAACSGGSPSATPGTPAPPIVEQTSPLPPQTGPAPVKPGASPQAGCPVDAATLEKAFNADAKLAADIQVGDGLTDISCVLDYATALTRPTGVDKATVLFHYDGTEKRWVALGGGTSNVCDKVPADVRKQLRNCG
jgi:hypothetical protein